jgi:putative two-component system response regulator
MAVVLVVDDDPQVRGVVSRVLDQGGHRALGAASVAEARGLLAGHDVDLVICDVNLPGESGVELLREIGAALADTAVFMLTGVDDPAVAREALELGATAYVVKPFVANEILINVANSLRLRDLERHRRAQAEELESKLLDRNRALQGALRDLAATSRRAASSEQDAVDRLAAALTLHDDETGAHIDRMSRYAMVLAREQGIETWPLDGLRLATMLHDVGKIGIPDTILLKAGPLTDEEFAVVKRHPEMGYRLLAESDSEVLRLGASIAWTHHERWDGTGYPRGLARVDIPVEGRIAAVADVFDALTSNRCYRPAMDPAAAVGILRDGQGRHFDPELVDRFIGAIDEILETRARHPDPVLAEPIRVLLVDDHAMFAESVARLLGREEGLRLVATAASSSEAFDAARRHRPDVVLMDHDLPDGDGLSAVAAIRSELPDTKVVLVTGRTDDAVLVAALKAGCAGFLDKTQTIDRLVGAVRSVHAGEAVVPPGKMAALLGAIRRDQQGGPASQLTVREIEVLDLVARGLQVEAIAGQLFLSMHTVRNHVQRAMEKLGAHSRLEAVTIAVRQGIVGLGHP